MWIKTNFKIIGRDDVGELTVIEDSVLGFSFTKVINPTTREEVEAFVLEAKEALLQYTEKETVKATKNTVVDLIITNLNK